VSFAFGHVESIGDFHEKLWVGIWWEGNEDFMELSRTSTSVKTPAMHSGSVLCNLSHHYAMTLCLFLLHKNSVLFFVCVFICFETESHLLMLSRLALNLGFFCLCLLSAGVTGCTTMSSLCKLLMLAQDA
jgi:hypothetical protein